MHPLNSYCSKFIAYDRRVKAKQAAWLISAQEKAEFQECCLHKGLILIYHQGNFHLYQYKTDPREAFGLQSILGLTGERQLCKNRDYKENFHSSWCKRKAWEDVPLMLILWSVKLCQ